MFTGLKVLEAGLEPARANAHRILSPACLPIPPLEQDLNKKTLFTSVLSEKRDSNPRPPPWQGDALPTELFSHFKEHLQTTYFAVADANLIHFYKIERTFLRGCCFLLAQQAFNFIKLHKCLNRSECINVQV